jgi:hypothetical protein
MALQYPFLFLYEEDGYRRNIMFANNKHKTSRKCQRVPTRAYYAYLINKREGFENTVIKGGQLY